MQYDDGGSLYILHLGTCADRSDSADGTLDASYADHRAEGPLHGGPRTTFTWLGAAASQDETPVS